MSAPTPLAENYLSVIGSSIVLGTAPATWTGTCTAGGLTATYEVDDMTNNVGAGAYEDVKTTYKYEGDITIAWKTATPPPFVSGDLFHTVITGPATGAPIYTGTFRFNGFMYPFFDPKSGFKIAGKLTSNGPIVVTAVP